MRVKGHCPILKIFTFLKSLQKNIRNINHPAKPSIFLKWAPLMCIEFFLVLVVYYAILDFVLFIPHTTYKQLLVNLKRLYEGTTAAILAICQGFFAYKIQNYRYLAFRKGRSNLRYDENTI